MGVIFSLCLPFLFFPFFPSFGTEVPEVMVVERNGFKTSVGACRECVGAEEVEVRVLGPGILIIQARIPTVPRS